MDLLEVIFTFHTRNVKKACKDENCNCIPLIRRKNKLKYTMTFSI